MNKKLYITTVASLVILGLGTGLGMADAPPSPAPAGDFIEYRLDKDHSSVSFTIRHMMVSKVRGKFNDFNLTMKENVSDIGKSMVDVTIKAASIDTGNDKRDNHLRSPDFFDVAKFPEITFKAKGITKKGDNYVMSGLLTMHGITKEIDIPFEILGRLTDPQGNKRIGIEGFAKLDRKDFGLKWNRALDKGGVVVGNEVKIEILLQGISRKK